MKRMPLSGERTYLILKLHVSRVHILSESEWEINRTDFSRKAGQEENVRSSREISWQPDVNFAGQQEHMGNLPERIVQDSRTRLNLGCEFSRQPDSEASRTAGNEKFSGANLTGQPDNLKS